MKKTKLIYFLSFIALLFIEIIIALFIRDSFIRPYFGDVLAVILIHCLIRTFFPNKIPYLPLFIFIFATAVEFSQYFDFVSLIGLGNSAVARIILGTSFSFADIICYLAGCIISAVSDFFVKKQ